MQHTFQVHLRGIIELLSNHLYSGPQVYIRELLQNGVDAIAAREQVSPANGSERSVRFSLLRDAQGVFLQVEDDGVGLTEPEVHRFLATIGESSKRDELRRGDYLGQFGIGLLSCFVVSEEIVVRSRTVRSSDAPVVEWRGKQDGTYTVHVVEDATLTAGTRVLLRPRKDREEWFDEERVSLLLREYGSLLRAPVYFEHGGVRSKINVVPPWRRKDLGREELDRAVLGYGKQVFGVEFIDWIPLRSEAGGADGVAYVLPFAPNFAERRTHRVHLKGMLVSDRAADLLPDWAFFARCVVDAEKLRPTASREGFYEDDALEKTREELGVRVRAWLLHLAKNEPRRLGALLAVHHQAVKALAAQDDGVLEVFAAWLPFETSLGTMTFGELRSKGKTLRFAVTVDAFRQMAPVATAQGLLLVNVGYAFDREVLQRACDRFEVVCEELEAQALTEDLDDVSPREREECRPFLRVAENALAKFGCGVAMKRFQPEELPAFYGAPSDAGYRRDLERAQERSGGAWSDLLGSLAKATPAPEQPLLCFNYRNPTVRRLVAVGDEEAVRLAVRMLYVQALLLGHHPLRGGETELLATGLLGLIEWGLDARRGGGGMLQ